MSKDKAKSTGLTKKHWFGYMFGDWGGCMTFALMSSMFTVYCTDCLQIDPGFLGTLVIIWTIWDAINDPMMGALMDKAFAKKANKNGKFRPWLLRATPLLGISFIALWTAPTFFEGTTKLVVLFALKILYEGAYTMFNIPMGSLLSAMSTNDAERASLSSARGVGSMIGNMIPAMLGPVILSFFDSRESTPYAITSVVCAGLGFVVCLLHYFFTEERTTVGEDAKADDINFSDILVVIKKNRPFVALCIHGICICTMQYIGQTLSMYMFKSVFHNTAYQAVGTALSSPIMIGSMIAVPIMCKKLGLMKVIRSSLLIGGAIYVVLFALNVIFVMNPLVHSVLAGLAMGMCMVSIQMQWGLVGEAIDYNELVTGKRTEGSIYGTFNLARRIGQTIGNGFALYALGWIGYNGKVEIQSDATVLGIKVLCVLLPSIFVLGSWAAFRFVWKITPGEKAAMDAKKVEAKAE